MKKFSIYKPKAFYWTRTYISYASMLCIGIVFFISKAFLFVPASNSFYNWLLFALLLPFIYNIVLGVMVTNKYRPLKGKLEGYITFHKEYIVIADLIYSLSSIKKIEFDGTDWLGLEIGYSGLRDRFENPLSQGVDNTLVLHLVDGQIVRMRFQLIRACEFSEVEDIIIHYHLSDKVSYLQTAKLLCLTDQESWSKLKEMKLQQFKR